MPCGPGSGCRCSGAGACGRCWAGSSAWFCRGTTGARIFESFMGEATIPGVPMPLPVTVSESQLAEAAARPLPEIGTTARVLLACARETLSADQAEHIRALCAQVQDWERFIQQAEFRMIVPLVHRHLRALPDGSVPADVLDQLKARTRRAAMQNLAMIAVHHRLVRDVLEPLGVPYLFFKGPSLAYRYYRDPGLRQFRDIDLLIPRQFMVKVGQRVREVGFRSHKHPAWSTDDGLRFLQRFVGMMDWVSPEGVLVEMPSSLDGDWDRLPTDEMIAQAESVDIGGLRVPVPPDADFLCYLCKHHSRHHWARLHWIADLNAILAHPEFDLDAVRQRARQRGFERTVEAALALQRAAAAPEPWRANFSDPFAHELFRHCLLNLEGDFEQELALRESFPATSIDIDVSRRRRRHRLTRNLHRFKPRSEDFIQRPLPARWHSLYYILRPFLFMSRRPDVSVGPD
ncbi:MAG: hypothetical protein EA370_15770 [Wenzhouxiangella sp.]|nr:MAG: hypothetical protein EA370_15770 [Wenzhouxiangella sp.]